MIPLKWWAKPARAINRQLDKGKPMETKHWTKSTGIQGSIVTAVSVLAIVGAFFGIDIDKGLQTELVDVSQKAVVIAGSVTAFIGTVRSIIGRIRADTKIG